MPRSADILLSIAAGSALGGVARYLLTDMVQARSGGTFPFGTLVVNLVGCLLLGFIVEMVHDSASITPAVRALLTVGFCGGFTTFSTFSLEAVRAVEEGAVARAAIYLGTSVVAGILGIVIGTAVARLILQTLRGSPA